MAAVIEEDPGALLERFAALPAAQPLLGGLAESAEPVYLVGGAVRDLMLGSVPVDLDLVVPAGPEALAAALGAALRLHDRFGTASVALDGHRYDLARPRHESYAHPGALPTVAPGSVEQDLARRDFTVNAIALGLAGPARGRLASHGTALSDLRQGLLRVLHEASFSDDPTRMLRLARYQGRLDFAVEPHTRELLRAALSDGAAETVSGNRLGTELRLLAEESGALAAMRTMHELGIGDALAPGFGSTEPGVTARGLGLLPSDGDRAALILAAAGLSTGPAELAALLERLAFAAGQRDRILQAVAAPGLARHLAEAGTRPSALAGAVAGAGPEAVALAGALGPADAAQLWLDRLRHVQLSIDGNDLLATGVPPGRAIGQGLRAALAAKLDGEAEGREAELKAARAAVDHPAEGDRPGDQSH